MTKAPTDSNHRTASDKGLYEGIASMTLLATTLMVNILGKKMEPESYLRALNT